MKTSKRQERADKRFDSDKQRARYWSHIGWAGRVGREPLSLDEWLIRDNMRHGHAPGMTPDRAFADRLYITLASLDESRRQRAQSLILHLVEGIAGMVEPEKEASPSGAANTLLSKH